MGIFTVRVLQNITPSIAETARLMKPDEYVNTPEKFRSSRGALMSMVYIGHIAQSIRAFEKQNNFLPASVSIIII